MRPAFVGFSLFCVLFLSLIGCSSNRRVVILVDGERRVVETRASTVGDVLREQGITLGDQDRVDPPDYTPIERTATIQIVRVVITGETKTEPVEFQRIYTREENLPEGQVRVSQLGVNGEAEIDYQITLEEGKEVSRRETARRVLKQPTNELLLIGTQGAVASVDISGTLAYIGKGNAWLVRGSTGERRPLTTDGALDGRVFDLSPDGKLLLFSRTAVSDSLNTLWVIDTVPFNAEPRRIPLDNVLYAQWAPDGSSQIAYTRGDKTAGAPGWKAYNDLNLATLNGLTETLQVIDTDIQTQTVKLTPTPLPSDTPLPTATINPNITPDPALPTLTPLPTYTPRPGGRVFTRTIYITSTRTTTLTQTSKAPLTVTNRILVPPSAPVPYSWWGWNLAWSPDARYFAYAFADQVGLVPRDANPDAPRGIVQTFAAYDTHSAWVWEPQLAWSPDARFVAATIHAPPNGAERAEDATGFDVMLFGLEEKVAVPIARNTGMWAFPAWSPPDAHGESKIAFGVAQNQVNSERSLYNLDVMDRDGSNQEQIYPALTNSLDGVKVVQFTWSPDASRLIALRDGDLWLYDLSSKKWTALTANGDSKLARWR